MAVTPDNLFGLQQLGDSVALFDEPGQKLILQDEVFSPEPCYADSYRFDREDFELSFAPFVAGRGTSSIGVKVQDRQPETIALAHIRIHKIFTSAQLFGTRPVGEISDNAAVEIAKARRQLRQRCRLARERVCAMALTGTVTINKSNFPDSETSISIARAVTTLSAQSASWATPATKIISDDLQDWRQEVRQASGYEPTRALFSKNVVQYLLGNTEAKDWLSHTQKGVNLFSTAQFSYMGGMDSWIEHKGFYIPEGGSATLFIPANTFFLLPAEPAGKLICRLIEGFGEIPTNAIGGPGAGGAIAGAIRAPNPGYFEYALPLDGDPPGVKLVAGDYFMALIKLPEAIGYEANVTA